MYKKNISKKIVRKIACKYVRCIDNTTYLERLAQVEAVMNCCRDQEFSSSNPKADEYRDLACPALVRQASESIRAFPPEEDFSTVRFYACVKRYLENHGHQGSYVVGPNYASTKQFLKEVEEAIGYADSTGWQALEVQPQLLAPQIFQETPIS